MSFALEDSKANVTVQLVGDDLWRLLFFRTSAEPEKTSETVVLRDNLPFSIDDSGPTFERDPLRFSWHGIEARVESARRLVLPIPEGRRHYGLGERTGFLDKTGRSWTNWTTDNWQHTPDADPLYQAHPFVILAGRGQACGLFVDESWKTTFDLGSTHPEQAVIETEGPFLDLYLIPGPSLRDVVGNFTRLTGRAPFPPLWAFGYHQCRYSYPNETEVRRVAKACREHDLPLDVIWLDIDYMDDDYKVFTFSPDRFPDPSRLTRDLASDGVRTVAIVDPGVKKEPDYSVYKSGTEIDAFLTRPDGSELEGHVWPKPAVWPDFSRADVREWWGDLHEVYLDAGVAGIWNDMNEPSAHKILGEPAEHHTGTLPLDTVHAGGATHEQLHNLYGYHMCKATFDALRKKRPDARPFVLTRSGFSGIQKYAWVWTGDNHSWWEHIEASIPMLLNLSLSGVPFCGADIGGFGGHAQGEMLARWTWLGAFYPFMRNHSYQGTRAQEPWCFTEQVLDSIREALRFRYALLPLLYTLAREACDTGVPPLRPLVLEFPDDPDTEQINDQFLLGSHLLVSPISRPAQSYRLAYVPRGSWQDFWTGNRVIGEGRVVTHAPLDRIPILQRAGSALPFTAPAPHTTDAWWEVLRWRIVPGPTIAGRVYEDDGDGYEPGTVSELSGVFDGRRMALQFDDKADRGRDLLEAELRGMPDPSRVSTHWVRDGAVLRIALSADETTVIEW